MCARTARDMGRAMRHQCGPGSRLKEDNSDPVKVSSSSSEGKEGKGRTASDPLRR